MSALLGIIAAGIAFLSWGFGDFALQRTIRRIGSLDTLFYVSAFGGIVLLPFVWKDIPYLFSDYHALELLGFAILVGFISAVLNFESFKRGKLAVIEPVMSSELVVTALISIVFIREKVTTSQILLMLIVFMGILLTMIRVVAPRWWWPWGKRGIIERGVLYAAMGAVVMSLYNVFIGLSSRATNPLITIWFTHLVIAFVVLLWLTYRGQSSALFQWGMRRWKLILGASALDTSAWIAYAAAALFLPIAITIAITESYVVLAAMLGIFINKERLARHQVIGGALALVAAIVLAVVSTR